MRVALWNRSWQMALVMLSVFVGAGALGVAVASAKSGSWKIIDRTDEGYEIALREEAGRDLPTMRGRGVLDGDLFHVLAVILDARRATEWAEGASSVKILETKGLVAELVYTYTELKWPVSDRDVIMRGTLKVVEPGREYHLDMVTEQGAVPVKEDVVRIKDSSAHFHLKAEGAGKVRIEYLVNVDPGGSLPKWLIRWASKGIPAGTLRDLQTQIDKTRGQYAKQADTLRSLR